MPRPIRSGYAPVNGITMYYAIFGQGSPILLVHVGGGNADMWASEIPILAQRHTVIVADTRGHGRSTWNGEPLNYRQFAADYVALLDYLHIPKVALAGVSDGAIIGLEIAVRHPRRLSKLFAQSGNVTPDGFITGDVDSPAADLVGERERADYKRLSPTPEDFQKLREALRKLWREQPNFTTAELQSIRVPTVIAIPEHEEFIERSHTRYIVETIPGATSVILPATDHYAPLQDPAGYAKAILDFVDG